MVVMKKLFQLTVLSLLSLVASCTKEKSVLLQNTAVKVFPTDSDMATLGTVLLDDGNYILAGYDDHNPNDYPRNPGRIIKIDGNGKQIWSKRLMSRSNNLFRILPIPGKGFLTFGVSDYSIAYMDICIYNTDGDSIGYHKVYANGYNSWMAPYDMIRLSNGNYAVAGGDEFQNNKGYLTILDPNFNSLYVRTFKPPGGYSHVSFHGMCETPDGSIALTANTYGSHSANTLIYLTLMIRTDLMGVQKSYTFLYDSAYDETANAVAFYANGLFSISSRRITNNIDYGTFTNYTDNYNGSGLLISGAININLFTNDSVLLKRKVIADYPANGMLNSVRATADGGFLCCGTVNQATSAVLVSETKIYLLRLDANLNEEWSKILSTTYQAIGVDAIQTPDGGFLVSGYQRSMNEKYEMMVLKTDANGNF